MSAGGHALSQSAQVLKPLRTIHCRGLLVLGRADTLSLVRQLLTEKSQQRLAVGTRSLRNRSLEFFEAHGLRKVRLEDESLKNDSSRTRKPNLPCVGRDAVRDSVACLRGGCRCLFRCFCEITLECGKSRLRASVGKLWKWPALERSRSLRRSRESVLGESGRQGTWSAVARHRPPFKNQPAYRRDQAIE